MPDGLFDHSRILGHIRCRIHRLIRAAKIVANKRDAPASVAREFQKCAVFRVRLAAADQRVAHLRHAEHRRAARPVSRIEAVQCQIRYVVKDHRVAQVGSVGL